ncbi:hypothetical protein MMC07_007859 [Pseudocyphellaria aurata]|nr:hypothetical protein [Pseudocyphellaria aurata]
MRDDHSALGSFLYPPKDNELTFNYRDTVNVSWTTSYHAHSSGYLSLWNWPGKDYVQQISVKIGVQTLNADSRHAGLNKSVPLNGSETVDLAVTSGWYQGQFNINFKRDDGTSGKYLSEFFTVDHNPSQTPLAWPGKASSQVSLSPDQSTTASSTQFPTQPSSLSSEPSSSPSSQPVSTSSRTTTASGLGIGAIAGISVGSALVFTLILTFILFVLRDRRRRRSQASHIRMPTPVQFPAEMTAFSAPAELAQPEKQWRELSDQTALRELPATDGHVVRGELPAYRNR